MGAETGTASLIGRRAECEALDRLLSDALAGRSGVTVIRGEAGVGKSALLAYVSERTAEWQVARATGIESEMELAYSGLHQLCAPMLDRLDRLPTPQQEALSTVLGLTAGAKPDRFLVGLATLTLLAEVAEQQPLACIVDDAQWLDQASAQILGFAARRLLAERIAVVCAARTGSGDDVLAALPALPIGGLEDGDARALLLANVHGPLDAAVCEQIIVESRGNPLALLELPRTWSSTDLAGGFGLPDRRQIAGRIERSYEQRLVELPAETRLLLLAAAAEPLGDPVLLYRAAETMGLSLVATGPAVDARLIRIGARVEFAHPLVRSVVYRSGSPEDRQRVHRALAEATDAETDPDRRAWHRARATDRPDEAVATELERSAGRARSRGGLAAAAAFLERATALTPEASLRAERALAAAQIKYEAGSLDDAQALLAPAEAGLSDELKLGRVRLLRARIAFARRHSCLDGLPLLLRAARETEGVDASLARETYLEALHAGLHAGRLDPDGVAEAGEAALACPPPPGAPRPRDLLLDGLAARVTRGYAAGAPALRAALAAFVSETTLPPEDAGWIFLSYRIASDLWDDETHRLLCERELARARELGALAWMPALLETRTVSLAVSGELDAAAATVDELRLISEATGVTVHGDGALLVAALRGREPDASAAFHHATEEAGGHGEGLGLAGVEHMTAILYNGLGRYEEALSAVRHAGERLYEIGTPARAVSELVEAASKCGDEELASTALERLSEMGRSSGTPWVLGVEARSQALLAEGAAAEALYREAIDRLGATRLRPDLARAHLVYGEWLCSGGRRDDARNELRTAHGLFDAMGMEAFTERARRELRVAGEKVRARTDEPPGRLTAQEEQIARLARDGFSNAEIGATLFLSPRTVEWHLHKVFAKLGIKSRSGLRTKELGSERKAAVS